MMRSLLACGALLLLVGILAPVAEGRSALHSASEHKIHINPIKPTENKHTGEIVGGRYQLNEDGSFVLVGGKDEHSPSQDEEEVADREDVGEGRGTSLSSSLSHRGSHHRAMVRDNDEEYEEADEQRGEESGRIEHIADLETARDKSRSEPRVAYHTSLHHPFSGDTSRHQIHRPTETRVDNQTGVTDGEEDDGVREDGPNPIAALIAAVTQDERMSPTLFPEDATPEQGLVIHGSKAWGKHDYVIVNTKSPTAVNQRP
eukprot:5875880-Pyramimonas_sp.AAC.1